MTNPPPPSDGLDLPDPEDAERWEALVPGSAREIVDMMQTLVHLHVQAAADERTRVQNEQSLASASLGVAAILSFMLIVAAIVFFAFGNAVAGGLLLGIPATGLAIAFIPRAIAGKDDEN